MAEEETLEAFLMRIARGARYQEKEEALKKKEEDAKENPDKYSEAQLASMKKEREKIEQKKQVGNQYFSFFEDELGTGTWDDLVNSYKESEWYELVQDKDSGKCIIADFDKPIAPGHWRALLEKLDNLKSGGDGNVSVAAAASSASPKGDDSKNDGNKSDVYNEATPGNGDNDTISYPNLAVVSDATESRAYKKLEQFYAAYNPQKLDDKAGLIDTLNRYQGKEDELFRHLEQKYILGASRQQLVYRNLHEHKEDDPTMKILERLADIYGSKIRPLEELYSFPQFHTPLMNRIDFLAKPMVLLVGQYSVGKTSFIKYLVGRDFPGISIGPEPTTDSFFAVMHGAENTLIPGHTVPMQTDKPFKSLLQFGDGFLNKFRCAECNSPILESITFVDTPGILSGAKQRLGRNYDFAKVIEWFAYRCDRILLLFDAHKLDISDEFKSSIEVLKGHDDKIRCVLNKADQVTNQQLLRVYGALMWSLGKVFKTPEVLRVYVGSFWNEPYRNKHNAQLFDRESDDLIADLKSLPRHTATRKINEFMKRVRQLRVHLFVCSYLKQSMPVFGKDKKKNELLENMANVFKTIADESGGIVKAHNEKMAKKHKKQQRKNKNANKEETDDAGGMNDKLLLQNFPDPREFRKRVEKFDFTKFEPLDDDKLEKFDEVFKEIPQLLRDIPSAKSARKDGGDQKDNNEMYNPFAQDGIEDAEVFVGKGTQWVVTSEKKSKYDNIFFSLELKGGCASADQVKAALSQYGKGLGDQVLGKIWSLAYIDRRITSFDSDQFALALWLIDFVKTGNKLPISLTPPMVPPSKRYLIEIRVVDDNDK